MLTIGVDIGGTKVAAGVVDEGGNVLDRSRRETPQRGTSPPEVAQTIADVVAELAGRTTVAAVGVAAAGFVNDSRSRVVFSPHLSWRNEPLPREVERIVGLPVFLENDANAAAWAESRFGAGRAETHLVCVTLGTGIGGAMLVDGALQRGRFGLAGEFGHMQVVPGGHRCLFRA